jgi:hypothetical protein
MEIVKPELYQAGVFWVLGVIDGDGRAALDADELMGGGIPWSFLVPLVETIRLGDVREVSRMGEDGPAPAETRVSSIWSLDLLHAIATHYGLVPPASYIGHSRNARVLSEIIRAYLEQRDPCPDVWQ